MSTASIQNRQLAALSFLALVGLFFWALAGGPGKPNVKEVTVQEAKALIEAGALVLDVREREVAVASHLPGAYLIPLGLLAAQLSQLEAYKTKPIVVYCNEGNLRGPQATEMLNKAGFGQAVNLKSGIEGWRAAKLPTQSS